MTAYQAGAGGLLAQPFMQHALLAGTGIALAAGIVGYFLVLRAQVFTADALGHVAYTGALGALAYGVNPLAGLFIATVGVGAGMAGVGGRSKPDDVVIGSTFAWILGLGAFFSTVYASQRSHGNGAANVTYLFGSIFGISGGQAAAAAVIGLTVCILVVVAARPLLFSSLDEAVAAARGVRVQLLGAAFLVVVGVTCAEAAQAVGALLMLGLIAAPAGAAQRLTTRPFLGLALSAAIAVGITWLGLVVSYVVPGTPPSFAILSAATLAYLGAVAVSMSRTQGATRRAA